MNIVGTCNDPALIGILSVTRKILEIIQIVVPILLLISISLTFMKLVAKPDEKKYLKNIKNSIISTFIIFFIPIFINVLFNAMGESNTVSSCWQMAGTIKQDAVYMPIEETPKKTIFTDPDEYEQGIQIKKLEQLIYYSQMNYPGTPFCTGGNDVAKMGCGSVSYAMIASSYNNPTFEPVNVSNWFCQNKLGETDGGLTNAAATASDAAKHFGLRYTILFDKSGSDDMNYGTSYNPTEGNAMLQAVQNGKAVMFGMPRHWSVLGPHPSCSENQFYLYNPGRPTSNGCYTPQELFNFTYNYGNYCNTIAWCGWDIAIAFSN